MSFNLKPLAYPSDALEPYIDKQTMEIHHDRHHQAYVDNLNKAVEGTEWADKSIEEILQSLDKLPEDKKNAVRNNGGGHFNHELFWESMTPGGSKEPVGKLKEAIEERFGSVDAFKEAFEKKGLTQFGSGWAWLILKDGKLEVASTPNQDNPISQGAKVLLGNDVWEHAYYLKYQNKRAEYLKNWWNVVNWDVIEKRFQEA